MMRDMSRAGPERRAAARRHHLVTPSSRDAGGGANLDQLISTTFEVVQVAPSTTCR